MIMVVGFYQRYTIYIIEVPDGKYGYEFNNYFFSQSVLKRS